MTILAWWKMLGGITLFNLIILLFSYKILQKKLPSFESTLLRIRKWQFFLSTIYVVGCGFRALLPRGDLLRIVLYDSWISSIVIGRSVATLAELSFVAQWSLLLYEASVFTGNKTLRYLAFLPVPIIVIAESFSWYACTTSNPLGTVFEESMWVVAAVLTLLGFLVAKPYYEGKQRLFFNAAIFSMLVYIVYMVSLDIPTYYSEWLANQAAGKVYLSVSEGFREICTVWNFTREFSDWQYEMVWMPLYFGPCVWMSMYLINAPQLDKLTKT